MAWWGGICLERGRVRENSWEFLFHFFEIGQTPLKTYWTAVTYIPKQEIEIFLELLPLVMQTFCCRAAEEEICIAKSFVMFTESIFHNLWWFCLMFLFYPAFFTQFRDLAMRPGYWRASRALGQRSGIFRRSGVWTPNLEQQKRILYPIRQLHMDDFVWYTISSALHIGMLIK